MSHDDTVREALRLTVEAPVVEMFERRAEESGLTLRQVVGGVLRAEWVAEAANQLVREWTTRGGDA